VKHGFLAAWRNYNHILLQRNTLLKKINGLDFGSATLACSSWDELFLDSAIILISIRQQYFDLLEPKFNFYINKLLPKLNGLIKLTINHGIPVGKDNLKDNFKNYFKTVLTKKLPQDLYRGFTSIGPHRFDLIFKLHDHLAKDLLSRGQEKMLIMALYLAQLDVIKQETGKKCTILIDDLAAELDIGAQTLIYQELLAAEHQLIISAINHYDIPGLASQQAEKIKMFHVEHLLRCRDVGVVEE
jgi:DNA replication and repair protein RecF